jgi:hypothetical protein
MKYHQLLWENLKLFWGITSYRLEAVTEVSVEFGTPILTFFELS